MDATNTLSDAGNGPNLTGNQAAGQQGVFMWVHVVTTWGGNVSGAPRTFFSLCSYCRVGGIDCRNFSKMWMDLVDVFSIYTLFRAAAICDLSHTDSAYL
ncbi:hypothetical protein DMENIID0001_121290 [Sergentomyia squamirostris]